jgi:hypothetical protein
MIDSQFVFSDLYLFSEILTDILFCRIPVHLISGDSFLLSVGYLPFVSVLKYIIAGYLHSLISGYGIPLSNAFSDHVEVAL